MSGRRTAKFKIEPFRHPLALDSNYAANTWKVLEDAIHEIHNQNASGLSFEELYRNAYMMVLQKHGDRVYDGLTNVLKQHLQGIAAQVEQHNGVVFLKVIEKKWADYQKSTQMIRDILMYMDRTYVRNQNKTPVFQLGMQLWRDHVVHHPAIRQRLLSVMLEMVQKERGGEVIDRPLMRALTKMLMALGQGVYVSDWEQPFLQTSAEFYQKEAQAFLADSNCPKYLQKAQKRLAEEKERVEHYMEASVTEHNITRVVDRELISKQMHTLTDMEKSGLVALLEADQYADLERMYLLFRRVDAGLDIIREKMGNHVKATGLVLVQDPENTKSAVDFVKVLLQLRSKYADVIAKGFDNDRLFQQSLNLAFESFINKNMRAPEFISLFIDDTLRKANKDLQDTEVEGVLDDVMVLFRYLQEKDMFEKYYKQHLGKRLLNGRVMCDDAERSLLVKLKGECGYQFTSKLESMFNDIRTSRETLQQFKQHASKHKLALPIELSVQHCSKCSLPVVMEQASQVFGDFYLETHSGRRLAWQTNLGTVDVKCCFGEGRSRRHELSVSTYQACVLMLFNDAQQITFRDIAAATDIPRADLKRALQSMSLIKGRNVLRKEPAGKEVEEEDVFSVNDNFTSKLFKVKIGTVSAGKDGEHEKAEVRSMVEEDRKPQIEAAIVRIMKARRLLDHNSIISEVTRQLQSRFLPSPAVIKKRIESLIEREFLERDPQDRKSYRYLA